MLKLIVPLAIALHRIVSPGIASAMNALPKPCALAGRNWADCAAMLDPLKNEKWRKTIPGGYRTKFGLQFHPQCFMESVSPAKLEQLAEAAFSNVLKNCGLVDSPLNKYAAGWVSLARRAVVTCNYKSIGAHAVNVGTLAGLDILAEKEALAGVDFSGVGQLDPLNKALKTTILYGATHFRRDLFPVFQNNVGDLDKEASMVLIHEIFHGVANRPGLDHEKLRKREQCEGCAPTKICDESVNDDRTFVLGYLCDGNETSRDMFSILRQRIDHCGPKRGCESMFTKSPDNLVSQLYSIWMPSRALSAEEAEQACDEIYDRDFCKKNRTLDLMRRRPEYKSIENKIHQTRSKLRIKTDQEIPKAWLKQYPALTSGLNAVSATACYQSVFAGKPDEEEDLRFQSKTPPHYWTDQERGDGSVKTEVEIQTNRIRTLINESPACKGKREADVLNAILDAFRDSTKGMVFDNILPLQWGRLPEPDFNSEFAKIIGIEDYASYFEVLRRFHPDSPEFDCKAAGLTPRAHARVAGKLPAMISSVIQSPRNKCENPE